MDKAKKPQAYPIPLDYAVSLYVFMAIAFNDKDGMSAFYNELKPVHFSEAVFIREVKDRKERISSKDYFYNRMIRIKRTG